MEEVVDYKIVIKDNLGTVLTTVGVSSGVASFVWNLFRKDVVRY